MQFRQSRFIFADKGKNVFLNELVIRKDGIYEYKQKNIVGKGV